MGFRFKKVMFICGESNFPAGNTDALRRTRSENIVSACAQAIIDCNCGWTLDVSKNQTITSYTDIPTRTGSKNYPGLFLINAESKCKLFIAHFGDEVSDYGIKDFSGNDIYQYHGPNYKFVGGLCMSMIPSGSNSVFGEPTTTTFIPSDATRIAGTAWRFTTCYTDSYNPTSGTKYAYGLFVSPYVIATSATQRSPGETWSLANPIYCIGRIVGVLAHEEDNAVNSKYGFVYFRNEAAYSDAKEGFYADIFWETNNILESYQSVKIPCNNPLPPDSCTVQACFSASDGTWLNGTDWAHYNTIAYVEGFAQLAVSMHRDSTSSRWVPIALCTTCEAEHQHFVIDSDGFKGYLDTELFRCALCAYDQTYYNGKFIGAGISNLLLGWDPNNESRSLD